ncbi:hypothetical protein LEP1GSC082_2583 [Leptospira kirschneri str. H2]|uniref:Uncharacterized protein n=1 Tax=Leptospira kirschneri str. H1 TaxID=1049966 RepID=A0A0E2BH61_9LEPT|nr:hypothetical protein LEP1GSC081_1112 [Leptospira kirschneri str. H1]EKO59374.1 hypothetical protein LEP1GSC082_2583 [Leptospira kirschneri str. H2]
MRIKKTVFSRGKIFRKTKTNRRFGISTRNNPRGNRNPRSIFKKNQIFRSGIEIWKSIY